MKTFHDLKLGLDESLEEKLTLLAPGYGTFRILRQSVDARGRVPHWVYSLEVYGAKEVPPVNRHEVERFSFSKPPEPVIIVGAGPAGLFAALRLVERGIPCRLFEQGAQANVRMRKIAEYWRYGRLDPHNNVCFGEGGAGLYSDGKLITRIKSPHIPYVLDRLIRFGAPEEIRYSANPHVGSDRIRKVIPPMREYLRAQGAEVRFDCPVSGLFFSGRSVTGVRLQSGEVVRGSAVILATGHSATSILHHLHENGVAMEGKSFAIGFRIEHPQMRINRIQYRDYAGHPALGAANYRLADHDEKTGIGVYSFCMCPGGYVISSGTEGMGLVSNGMSNYARNSPFANAAVVVAVDHNSRFGKNLFGGLELRSELETRAKQMVERAGGTKELPAQSALDFMKGQPGKLMPYSTPSHAVPARLDQLLPEDMTRRLRKSLETFERKMPGFLSPEAQLFGVETRTSCPVRVIRDPETLVSQSHAGLYPAGEGAGYAGGITSAAVDGVKIADAIAQSFKGTH